MAEEMSDVEREILGDLIHQIATHIVEGSAAVQEFRATIAKMKAHTSDLECVVAQNWLSASKIIQEASKSIKSWENFINALRITYIDDDEILRLRVSKKDDKFLENSAKELWRHGTTIEEKNTEYNIIEYNISDSNSHPQTEAKVELPTGRNLSIEKSGSDVIAETQPEMQVPSTVEKSGCDVTAETQLEMQVPSTVEKSDCDVIAETQPEMQMPPTVGQFSYNPPVKKKRPWGMPDNQRGKPKPRVKFSNGRALGNVEVERMKKSGRCFFCEGWGHRASECPTNPESPYFDRFSNNIQETGIFNMKNFHEE